MSTSLSFNQHLLMNSEMMKVEVIKLNGCKCQNESLWTWYSTGTVISKQYMYLILKDVPSDETYKGKIQHRMHQIYKFAF
jgi:hypothetical protein